MPPPFTDTFIDPNEFFSLCFRLKNFIVIILAMSSIAKQSDANDPFACTREFAPGIGYSPYLINLPPKGDAFCLATPKGDTFRFFTQLTPLHRNNEVMICQPGSTAQWLDDVAHDGHDKLAPIACPDERFVLDLSDREYRATCAYIEMALSHLASQHPDNETITAAFNIMKAFFETNSCGTENNNDAGTALVGLAIGGCLAFACLACLTGIIIDKLKTSDGSSYLSAIRRDLSELLSNIVDFVTSCLKPQNGCCPRMSYSSV